MENYTGIGTTTPRESVYLWVEEPKARGTLGILIFCLTTLIVCVWSALHFDIPQKRHSKRGRMAFGVAWMVVAVLCPEGLLASAIYQRIDASILEGYAPLYLQSETRVDTGWLTRVLKRFLGKAGGNEKDLELNINMKPPRKRQYPFGLIHAIYATMGGFAFNIPAGSDAGERHTVPNSKAFLYIMENFPDIIPDISEESITDRAESSPLSKALLIVQVGWFCANSLLRLIQHLPLSLLEVSTAAHSFCTLITYFVWWSKPQNIAEATPMKGQRAREVHALLMCSGREYSEALSMAQRTVAGDPLTVTNSNDQGRIVLAANALRHRLPRLEEPPPEDPFYAPLWSSSPGSFGCSLSKSNRYDIIPCILTTLLYGLPHFLGWNELFPTPLECQFWRVSTCVVTWSGFIFIILVKLGVSFDHVRASQIAALLLFLLYIMASGFLVGESLRQLLFLDPAAYQVASWSSYWPHFS